MQCLDLDQVRGAIEIYVSALTPSKCRAFISHLKEVNKVTNKYTVASAYIEHCLAVPKSFNIECVQYTKRR